jgi:hypothetical protein
MKRMASDVVRKGSSPYIHPPLKNAPTRCIALLKRNRVKCKCTDVARCARVFVVEVVDEVGCMYIGGSFPGVAFSAESFPFDQVLKSPSVVAAVEDLFYFPLFFTVDDDQIQQGFCPAVLDWVLQC